MRRTRMAIIFPHPTCINCTLAGSGTPLTFLDEPEDWTRVLRHFTEAKLPDSF
jgi:hypothetical protein